MEEYELERKRPPERKRSIAIILSLVWIMLWTGILFAVGHISIVQIIYFPIGTVFGVILMALAIISCGYLTTEFIMPAVKELWKGGREK